jgi:DNA-binding LacI/PurR family transcriptional regulator
MEPKTGLNLLTSERLSNKVISARIILRKVAQRAVFNSVNETMPRSKVSLAELARRLDTTPATVSRALRNHSRISKEMCRRAAALAEELGYRRDPEISRLMKRVRTRRDIEPTATLGLLLDGSSAHEPIADAYIRGVIAGATERARTLGYALNRIALREPGMSQERLDQILQTRGIHGVLIPPQLHLPEDIVLPTGDITVVAATAARAHLSYHRVFPDHYENMRLLMHVLIERGYRRIGLVTTPDIEERQRNFPRIVYEWMVREHAKLKRIPPFIAGSSRGHLTDWWQRHGPDVLIAPDRWAMDEFQRQSANRPAPPMVLFGNRHKDFAGIEEQPEAIGAAAIDLLGAEVESGENRHAICPKNVALPGRFIEGASLPSCG